jgi:hypothetical protein
MLRFLLSATLSVALMTGSAEAYALLGPGVSSCATWAADNRRDPVKALMNQSWVLGFLSGAGYAGSAEQDPLHGVDSNAVIAWVDKYCRTHPLDPIVRAAEVFIDEHHR